MEPKPCPNPAQNASNFHIMWRTLKNESEQTLPHFSSFLLFPNLQKPALNEQKNLLKFRPIWDSLLEAQKTGFLTFFCRCLDPNMGPSWVYVGSEANEDEFLCWLCVNTAGRDASKPTNLPNRKPISVRNGSKVSAHGLQIQL